MKTMNLTNIGILAGAVAVGYVIYKAVETKNAMQGLANNAKYTTQYTSPFQDGYLYGDWVTGKKELSYL